jgi:hypothetical protein
MIDNGEKRERNFSFNQEVKWKGLRLGMDHDGNKEKEGNPEDRYL